MSERIPFDIKYRPEIEAGKYLVVTRSGEPVRIVGWDSPGLFPITAILKRSKRLATKEGYTISGHFLTNCVSHAHDLSLVPNPDYKETTITCSTSVDWDAFRREAAKDFVAAYFANPNCNNLATDSIIKNCIVAADELIWNLKKRKK